MGEDGPAWYYVDGQLRYRDRDGWTDRYQTIDRASGSNVAARDEPAVLGPATRAEARKRANVSSRHKSRPSADATANGPAVTKQDSSGHRTAAGREHLAIFRRISAVVLIISAIGVWFGMSPSDTEAASGYHQAITASLAADTKNSKTAHGAAQQAVVNGWTARDLLTILAQEGADPRSVDERTAALLLLLVIGLGVGMATTRLTFREPG